MRLTRRQFQRAGTGMVTALAGASLFPARPVASATSLPNYPNLSPGDVPLLVDAVWLGANLQREDLLVLDLSELSRYRQGHIPGAVHAWWQDTMHVHDPVYGTVLQPIDFTDQRLRIEFLQALGITSDITVVAYDDDRGRWAARLVWFLRFLGHDRVSALEGGLAAWSESDAGIEHRENDPVARSQPTVQPRTGYYLGDLELAEWQIDPRTLLVDVRTDEEVRDDVNGTLPIGRIPGAVPLPWTTFLLDDAGRLRPADEIAALLNSAGIERNRRIVLYARFGVETAHTWLVLSLIGFPEFVIYDRGWAGWVANPDNPIAPI